MGYYSTFEVEWDNTKTTIEQQKLISEEFNRALQNEDNFYPHFVTVEDSGFTINCKWYDMDIDLINLSVKVPNIVFTVNALGEDGDNWQYKFKSGKMLSGEIGENYPDLIFKDDE